MVLSELIRSDDLTGRTLHVAPEEAVAQRLVSLPAIDYFSTDLQSPAADVHADIAGRLPFGDCSFDAVLCSHVLEHVHDDRAALDEIYRVPQPGGRAFLLVPIGDQAETSYDPTVTDPAERGRLYGQEDHVRTYGQDFTDFLGQLNWTIEPVQASVVLNGQLTEMALLPHEKVFVCRREGSRNALCSRGPH